jgi:hypothetical protein
MAHQLKAFEACLGDLQGDIRDTGREGDLGVELVLTAAKPGWVGNQPSGPGIERSAASRP